MRRGAWQASASPPSSRPVAGALLALDHSFTSLTAAGISLAAGATIIRKADS